MATQEIKCIHGDNNVVGTIELREGEAYKGDAYYGMACYLHNDVNEIDAEYARYLKRKSDGERAFLMLMSELRLYSKANNLGREVNRFIEDKLEFVKSQVIEGQWVSALEKLDDVVVEGYLTQDLYDRIHLEITTYVNQNY